MGIPRRALMVLAALAPCLAAPAQAQTRATGGVLLPPAEYVALPKLPRYRAFLPLAADLSPWFPEPGDQKGQPSCTAWATGYALRSYYANRQSTAAPTPLSPSFVYNQLAEPRGACRSGITISSALTLLRQNGVPPLSEFSYSQANCDSQPSADVKDSASLFRIHDWQSLEVKKLDDLKGQIANGNPVVVAMRLPASFFTASGSATFDDVETKSLVHAMVLTAYNDERGAFRLINSWGTGWGDHGFLWISYRAVSAMTAEAYAVTLDRPLPPLHSDEVPPKPEPEPKPEPVVVTPPKPDPSPHRPTIAEAQAKLRNLVRSLKCAKVESSAKDGILTLGGFVSTEEDRNKLVAALGDGGPAWQRHLDLTVEPWPHCEARLTLGGAVAQSSGLAASIEGGATMKEGEALTIEVVTPNYPSHLYVSYLQADGQVAHLRRYGDAGWKPIPPKTRLTLGGAGEWKVSGPTFGRESVVVVASALPLLALDRPATESEREYLTELRLGLLAQPSVKGRKAPSAVIVPLMTMPR
ncbi:hypothetical protein A6A04_20755 [Paramagnetospirillum marisnigri]|uniref:Peptidase C1A papain C-terminal domain-containing protein n=1 Tax=Paramagnetospirillum marisnigri TaxID=1285242 RepID=A0A178MBC7_9PROT|nr:C1 family peptidase [Paramagnetospirillum marisnigri]OAN46101.1 hypothetical protein A6A04_20755 [Paramagnetospirillum marisnigri]